MPKIPGLYVNCRSCALFTFFILVLSLADKLEKHSNKQKFKYSLSDFNW